MLAALADHQRSVPSILIRHLATPSNSSWSGASDALLWSLRVLHSCAHTAVYTELKDDQQRAIVGLRSLRAALHQPRCLEEPASAQSRPSLKTCVFGCGEKL